MTGLPLLLVVGAGPKRPRTISDAKVFTILAGLGAPLHRANISVSVPTRKDSRRMVLWCDARRLNPTAFMQKTAGKMTRIIRTHPCIVCMLTRSSTELFAGLASGDSLCNPSSGCCRMHCRRLALQTRIRPPRSIVAVAHVILPAAFFGGRGKSPVHSHLYARAFAQTLALVFCLVCVLLPHGVEPLKGRQ